MEKHPYPERDSTRDPNTNFLTHVACSGTYVCS